MELLQMLTSQLGVTQGQAKGGAGLLFKMAKEKLSSDDFSQVAKSVPGIEKMISSTPEPSGLAGALGGLASSFGVGAGDLGGLASLAGGFKSLNLDSSQIGQFIPIILSFVQSKGGDIVKSVLEKALKQ